MRIFVCGGNYCVLNSSRDFIGSIFSNLVQAVAYCLNHNKQPIYTWEDHHVN